MLKLTIREVAFGGRGVSRLEDGRVVFVPFVEAGETVRVEVGRGGHAGCWRARTRAVKSRRCGRSPRICCDAAN